MLSTCFIWSEPVKKSEVFMETTTTAQRFFLFISTGFAVAIIVGLAVWQSGLSAKQSASTGEAGLSQVAEASISMRAAHRGPNSSPEPEGTKTMPLSSPNLSEDVFNDPLLPPRAYIAPEHISPTTAAADPSVRTMSTPEIPGHSNSSHATSNEASSAPQPTTTGTKPTDGSADATGQSTAQTPQPQTGSDSATTAHAPVATTPGNVNPPNTPAEPQLPPAAPMFSEPTDFPATYDWQSPSGTTDTE